MRIIDAHVHIFLPRIALAAVMATNAFYEGCTNAEIPVAATLGHLPGTAEDLLPRMKKDGVDRSVVFSTATAPHQVEVVNNFIRDVCRENPELIGVGTMHPDYPDFEGELRRMKANGLFGVKLHPDIQRFRLDDERLMPLFELMSAEGLFLIAHTGDYRYDYSTPRRMANVAKRFPKLRCIAPYCGGWSEWADARECLNLPNVYIDTSSTLPFGAYQAAHLAFSAFDPTHIFFGTDYPMWEPGEELERFFSLKLRERMQSMILGENFENFLKES